MGEVAYYFIYDTNTGTITGTGYTPDGTIPSGRIAATQSQIQNWTNYKIDTSTTPPSIIPYIPVLTLKQQAIQALNSGLTITLSGTMTLAATLFPTDASTQKAIESMNAMARAGVLPLGSTTYPMIDASGKWHHFTASQYQAVAGAIAAYVAACDLVAAGNPLGVTAIPQNSVALTV